nr:uncharacterized mitochondrial protein AtMg00810-like [Tanacetum cinerariifolium]
ASDYDNSSPAPQLQNVSPSPDTTTLSQQELDLLFGPLNDEFFTIEPTTPTTNVNAEENNNNQAADTQFQQVELINHFCTLAKYALEILTKHGMEKCQSIGTPMATKPKLDADLSGKLVDQTDYRKVKRIFRYLRGTINMGLWYPKDSGFELIAFLDADHVGCIDTYKSTSGGIQFLGDKLVSWMSKKQDCTAMSSAEVEYVALSASCDQIITEYQLGDMFTKALPEDKFKYLVRRIGMRCLTLVELEVLAKEFA